MRNDRPAFAFLGTFVLCQLLLTAWWTISNGHYGFTAFFAVLYAPIMLWCFWLALTLEGRG